MGVPLAVVAAPPVVAFAVAESGGGFDPISLIGYGITPVIVVVLFLMGKLRTEGEVKNRDETIAYLRHQVADRDGQLAALQTSVVEKAIPALTRTALILERLTPEPQFRER